MLPGVTQARSGRPRTTSSRRLVEAAPIDLDLEIGCRRYRWSRAARKDWNRPARPLARGPSETGRTWRTPPSRGVGSPRPSMHAVAVTLPSLARVGRNNMGLQGRGQSVRRHAAAPAARHPRRPALDRYGNGDERRLRLEESRYSHSSPAAHLEHDEVAALHR